MKPSEFDIYEHFTSAELQALKLFYEGMPARRIRPLHGDPWPVVARHRALPKDQYEAVEAALEKLDSRRRELRVFTVSPDDPIYKVGFVIGGRRLRGGPEEPMRAHDGSKTQESSDSPAPHSSKR